MGYVPVFCCVCAGPIGHGFGLGPALSEDEDGNPRTAPWELAVEEMRWLEKMRVLTAAGASVELQYEDFGTVDAGENGEHDFLSLNPVSWATVEDAEPGVPCHSDCLPCLESQLTKLEVPMVSHLMRAVQGQSSNPSSS